MQAPPRMITKFEEKDYLAIQPYSSALIRLLWPHQSTKGQPTFAASEVIKQLQQLRADAVDSSEKSGTQTGAEDLFPDKSPEGRRLRRTHRTPADQLATFEFNGVTLTCPAFRQLGQRQQVLLPLDDATQLEVVFDALAEETFENTKRPYKKKAKTDE